MMRRTGHSVVITAMVVATTVAVATAEEADDSTSDENLRQALVLVNILKSGILRRSQRRFAATPSTLADFAGYRPWPPPYTFNAYGPFRRMIDLRIATRQLPDKGDFEQRKDNNITRQMEYEDPFGPHPGGDVQETTEQATKGSNSLQTNATQPSTENKVTSKQTTKITEPTVTETKTRSTKKIQSHPPSKATTAKKTAATEKVTKTTKALTSSAKPAEKRKTKKPTKINTKAKTKKLINDKTTTKVSPLTKGKIVKLKYNKKSKVKEVIDHKRADEAEIREAVIELKREAADVGKIVEHRCAARRTPSGAGQTGALRNETQTSCVGPHCSEGNATQATTMRYKATTRVYLSRSIRPPIPLPVNNAFCYTNPENALCRTLI